MLFKRVLWIGFVDVTPQDKHGNEAVNCLFYPEKIWRCN